MGLAKEGRSLNKTPSEEFVDLNPRPEAISRLNPLKVIVAVAVALLVVMGAYLYGLQSGSHDDGGEQTPILHYKRAPETLDLPKSYEQIEAKRPVVDPSMEIPEPVMPSLEEMAAMQAAAEEREGALRSELFFIGPVGTGRDVTSDSGFLGEDVFESGRGAGTSLRAVSSLGGGDDAITISGLERPRSPFEVKAGTVIPAVLLTAINTDLPGDIIARVTENVFDTVSGRYVLIPQGSTLVGRYSVTIESGQDRALVVWHRIIRPSGDSIAVAGMPGTDTAGQAGFSDSVDFHGGRIAAGIGLSTLVSFVGNLARSPDNADRGLGDVVGDTVAQTGATVGQQIAQRALNVKPTITIRAGWPMRVLVNRDLVLTPYAELP